MTILRLLQITQLNPLIARKLVDPR